jgi:hypothetical protein
MNERRQAENDPYWLGRLTAIQDLAYRLENFELEYNKTQEIV